MTIEEVLQATRSIGAYLSEEHGDHEGGEPSDCQGCATLAAFDTFIFLLQQYEYEKDN